MTMDSSAPLPVLAMEPVTAPEVELLPVLQLVSSSCVVSSSSHLLGKECNNQCNEAADNCFSPATVPCTPDLLQCTDDYCNGGGQCVHLSRDGKSCDDGQNCTANDLCVGTQCLGNWTCGCAGDA